MKQIIAFLTIGILLNVGCSSDKSPTGPSGQTIETYTEKWDNGNKKVEYTYYYEEGAKKFHGYYREYAESGTLVIEGEYKEGERWNGQFYLYVEWHSDGTDDLEWNGVWRISDEGDRTLAKVTYSNGIWEGKATFYDDNGRVIGEENHVGGVLNGAAVGYHENGKTAYTLNYKDGKADGTVTEYDTEGIVTKESTYENGVCVNNCDSDVFAQTFSDIIIGTWKSGGEPIWTFNADGTVVFDGYEDLYFTWSIEGSTLTVTYADSGDILATYVITSLSSTEFVFFDIDYPEYQETQTR